MANQYNFEKAAQIIMKSSQAEAAMGRLSRQALKKEPGILSQVMRKLAHQLINIGNSILALIEKEVVLNS